MRRLLSLLMIPAASFAVTLEVDAGGCAPFASIQAAVDAAEDGDLVFIHPGVYYENVIVPYPSKDISFEGADERRSIIDAGGADKCLYFHFDGSGGGITIANLGFRNSGAGSTGGMSNAGLAIRGETDQPVAVTECIFRSHPYHCIISSADTQVSGTLFEGNLSSAVFLYGGGESVIANNTFVSCETGVYIASDAGWPQVVRNIFYDLSIRGIWSSYEGSPQIDCNDMWEVATPYVGCTPANSYEADPLFCGNPPDGYYALRSNSPCTSLAMPECGQIGAYDVDCGESAAGEADWSKVKTRF